MPVAHVQTALGPCILTWEGDRVTGFALPDPSGAPVAPAEEPPPWVGALLPRVARHLAGDLQDFADLPYAFDRVSPFQRRVYEAALTVKAGHTSTYGELATRLGLGPAGSRAVGTALGLNPWPLLIPCHRFVGADGRMTGFSAPGGVATKARLLAIEGATWF